MKFSLTGLKVSIAGAKLSHLVQKDRIWDHGSMTEQARIIFHLVYKVSTTGNFESLQKQCSAKCFEHLNKKHVAFNANFNPDENPVITELAVISVQPAKHHNPDMFTALIKGYYKKIGEETKVELPRSKQFCEEWTFIRQGEWWLADEIKTKKNL